MCRIMRRVAVKSALKSAPAALKMSARRLKHWVMNKMKVIPWIGRDRKKVELINAGRGAELITTVNGGALADG